MAYDSYYFKLYDVLKGYHLNRPHRIKRDIGKLTNSDCRQLCKDWFEVYKGLDKNKIWTREDDEEVLRYYPSCTFQEWLHKDEINRFLLYADKLVLNDPLTSLAFGTRSKEGAEGLLMTQIPRFLSYKPIFKSGIGELIPQRIFGTWSSSSIIGNVIMEDTNDEKFKKICYKNLDVGDTDKGVKMSVFDGQYKAHIGTVHFNSNGGKVSIPIPTDLGENIMIPSKPTDEDYQIADNLVKDKAAEINFDLLAVHELKANLVSDSEMVFQLLERKCKRKSKLTDNIDTRFLPSLLMMDLPFLANASTTKIIKLRRHLKDEFMDFRSDFRTAFKDIESIPYSRKFKKEVKDIKRDQIDLALRTLNRDFDRIKNRDILKSLGPAIFTTIPLIGSLFVNDIYQILAWASSTLPGVKTWDEIVNLWNELESKKGNSWYFLWRLT